MGYSYDSPILYDADARYDGGDKMASATKLRTEIIAALSASAELAGIAGVSSMASPPRIFQGDVGLAGGRNHGRLPFVEVWVEQRFTQEAQEGGFLQSVARIRWHVGGSPTNTDAVLALLDSLMAVSLKNIRNMTDSITGAPKYAFEGDTRTATPKIGPFGWQQDAELDVGLEYDSSNFGYG